MDLATIEAALNSGKMMVRMRNGNLWSVRRNGATKTWVRKPNEFRIPVKMGFKSYGEITHNDVVEYYGTGANNGFVIKE
jgi:hypothetical protein